MYKLVKIHFIINKKEIILLKKQVKALKLKIKN